MPLISCCPSVQQSHAFHAGLLHLIKLRRIPDGVSVAPHPHPVYNLRLQHVLANAGEGPVTGDLAGWRYYASSQSSDLAVAGHIDFATKRVTSLSYGDTVQRNLDAAKSLENLSECADGTYEPRLLRIPALLLEAFWLEPILEAQANTATGWIVPFHTLSKEVEEGKPYPVKDFFRLIRPLAENALAANPNGSGNSKPAPPI